MASCLFFNKADVLEAYQSRGIDLWSVGEAKSILVAGEGMEALDTALTMLSRNNVPATYTLRVYNLDIDANSVTNKTENNGEFKFKLSGNTPATVGGGITYVGNDPVSAITGKINQVVADKLGKVIDKMLSGEADEPAKPSLSEFVMGFIEDNPNVVMQVVEKISGFLRGPMPGAGVYNMVPTSVPAVVAGAAPVRVGAVMSDGDQNTVNRIAAVLDRLEKADPDILSHLEQLADLAEKKPEMYKMALSFLK